MISSLLNIAMPFALQRDKTYVFIIRAIQGLVEVGTVLDLTLYEAGVQLKVQVGISHKLTGMSLTSIGHNHGTKHSGTFVSFHQNWIGR